MLASSLHDTIFNEIIMERTLEIKAKVTHPVVSESE